MMKVLPGDGVESRLRFRVRYCETDQMRVVHHPNYFSWFENGRIDLLHRLAIDYADLERHHQYLPVVSCAAKYLRPARFDDELELRTVLLDATQSRLSFGAWLHDVGAEGEAAGPLTKLWSLHAFASGALAAVPFPEWLVERARPALYRGRFFSGARRSPPGF